MTPYQAAFPVGTFVRIGDEAVLQDFRTSWKFHHPLTSEQLGFAQKPSRVVEVGFYHGGAPLYVLQDIPGIWHEQCLRRDDAVPVGKLGRPRSGDEAAAR
jgi:hypothetical protein